jgi:aminoglycoside phosphotransferase (APT) family kinase protein
VTEQCQFDIDAFLSHKGMSSAEVKVNSEGWDSLVFEIDSHWIVRVPRRREVAEKQLLEFNLLVELRKAVTFALPFPDDLGNFNGAQYMMYRRLPGRPFKATDDVVSLGRAIAELHKFPKDRAAELLGLRPFQTGDWLQDYRKFESTIYEKVMLLLPEGSQSKLKRAFEQFFANTIDVNLVLVHRDLGPEHILMSDDGTRLKAIIDFGDAGFDDSSIDFVGVYITAGEHAARRAIEAYGQPVDWTRLISYYWMGSAHAALYGVEQCNEEITDEGVAELIKRLDQTVTS